MLFRFLGRLVFYGWLMPVAAVQLAWAAVMTTLELALRWTRRPWKTVFGDRLLAPGKIVWPALVSSFQDDYHEEDDGPGWSEEQIPRLWVTCRQLAEKLGCPPPDAIHLSIEPGATLAWQSKGPSAPLRRHICLSILDLRIMTHDEARAVIAHEITHAGFDHSQVWFHQHKTFTIMRDTAERLGLFGLPLLLASGLYVLGVAWGSHDAEREADQRAADVVGGNHIASALRITYVQGAVLERVFQHVLKRALEGKRAPIRLAEAAVKVFRSFDFAKLRRESLDEAQLDGLSHPSLPDRVAAAERSQPAAGIGGKTTFIEAYPELAIAEELLTKTYFPDMAQHTRSDASQLRRKALAARLKRR